MLTYNKNLLIWPANTMMVMDVLEQAITLGPIVALLVARTNRIMDNIDEELSDPKL